MTEQEKREKVIDALEYCKNRVDGSCVSCHYPGLECGVDVAIAMLKAQEARVMTLEEACGADECWLERQGKPVTVASLAFNGDEGTDVDSRELNTLREYVMSSDYYGEYWRCWTSRPTDAQREEAKWEWG